MSGKNPGKRYESAEKLADELDAFIEDRHIEARPRSQVLKAGIGLNPGRRCTCWSPCTPFVIDPSPLSGCTACPVAYSNRGGIDTTASTLAGCNAKSISIAGGVQMAGTAKSQN